MELLFLLIITANDTFTSSHHQYYFIIAIVHIFNWNLEINYLFSVELLLSSLHLFLCWQRTVDISESVASHFGFYFAFNCSNFVSILTCRIIALLIFCLSVVCDYCISFILFGTSPPCPLEYYPSFSMECSVIWISCCSFMSSLSDLTVVLLPNTVVLLFSVVYPDIFCLVWSPRSFFLQERLSVSFWNFW